MANEEQAPDAGPIKASAYFSNNSTFIVRLHQAELSYRPTAHYAPSAYDNQHRMQTDAGVAKDFLPEFTLPEYAEAQKAHVAGIIKRDKLNAIDEAIEALHTVRARVEEGTDD